MMKSKIASVVFIALTALPHGAQAEPESLGAFQAWDAFREAGIADGSICYALATPQAYRLSVGAPEGFARGPAYLSLSMHPAREIRDQVNIVPGFALSADRPVNVTVDDSERFELLADAETGAWLKSQADETSFVRALKKGRTLVVEAVSANGAHVQDRYDLLGMTAARDAAARACGVAADSR